ncbi:putative cyclin A2 [Rosa chinensis]|uniref:B-like cyclin n=1 Tax=Rosa chinensis TaxID=74649 RepID=A0A2P6PH75_ROSCH|nr:cyclin-D3-1 [Rosa chinensis]PRQ21284.1 putative cyclin A2 [Rosa chinensis]
MAPSFDCAVSSLLCAEDNLFYDNDFGSLRVEVESEEVTWNRHRNNNQNRGFDNDEEDGLPLQSSDEYLASIIEKESHHLPRVDYLKRLQSGDLDLGARNEAVDWIQKANSHFSFGPLCQYLSVSYLDRFLSAYEIPNGKAWTMQLLAVACLSLAAKMDEIDVPLSLDLQVAESKYVFEARTIQRMELLVLSTLRWRMQAVTPISFIDSFLVKLNEDKIPLKASIFRAVQLILSTTKGIDFLEFKPSEVAAAVAISVAGESKALDDTEKAISVLIQHVDLEKERVVKCVNVIQDAGLMSGAFKNGSGSVQSVPQSPIGVLDVACFSYKSDDHTTVGSCANSFHNGSDTKRRKLNRPYEVEL